MPVFDNQGAVRISRCYDANRHKIAEWCPLEYDNTPADVARARNLCDMAPRAARPGLLPALFTRCSRVTMTRTGRARRSAVTIGRGAYGVVKSWRAIRFAIGQAAPRRRPTSTTRSTGATAVTTAMRTFVACATNTTARRRRGATCRDGSPLDARGGAVQSL